MPHMFARLHDMLMGACDAVGKNTLASITAASPGAARCPEDCLYDREQLRLPLSSVPKPSPGRVIGLPRQLNKHNNRITHLTLWVNRSVCARGWKDTGSTFTLFNTGELTCCVSTARSSLGKISACANPPNLWCPIVPEPRVRVTGFTYS